LYRNKQNLLKCVLITLLTLENIKYWNVDDFTTPKSEGTTLCYYKINSGKRNFVVDGTKMIPFLSN